MRILVEPENIVETMDGERFSYLMQEETGRHLADLVCSSIISSKDNEKITLDFVGVDCVTPEAAWGFVSILFDNYAPDGISEKICFSNLQELCEKTIAMTMKRYQSLMA